MRGSLATVDPAPTTPPRRHIGATFGRWTILADDTKGTHRFVSCRCACGVEAQVRIANLRSGRSTQCVECRNARASEKAAVVDIAQQRSRKFHYFRSVDLSGLTSARAREYLKTYGKLVVSIAKEPAYWLPEDSIVDHDDLVSIGQTLMLQACVSYEEGYGTKMSTWVALCVRQGYGNVVRDARNISRTDAEKRKKTGETTVRIERLPPARLDEPVRTHEGSGAAKSTMLDFLDVEYVEKSDASSPFAQVCRSMQQGWLYGAIERLLTEREKAYVLATLDDEYPSDIGERDGVSRQRVEQIVERAKERLAEEYRREQRKKRLVRRAEP